MTAGDARAPVGRARGALAVAAGGAVGALARVGLGEALPHEAGTWAWSTLLENASGGLLLGALVVVLLERFPASRYARLLLGTGLLGGYTSFSALSVDAVLIVRDGRPGVAAAYVVLSLTTLLLAAAVGVVVARAALQRGRDRGRGAR